MKATRSSAAGMAGIGHPPGPGRRRSASGRGARRGLVLVASVGVLGVISVMGLAFATVMRLESRAAQNYSMAVRAEFVARAGLEDAIARLRIMAREGAEFAFKDGQPAEWYTWRGTAGGAHKVSFPARRDSNWYDDDGDGVIDNAGETGLCSYTDGLGDGGFYTLKIEDAASKINVNVGDNLGTMLDNLCRVIGSPLRAADQEALIPKWFSDLRQYSGYGRRGMNVNDRVGTYDLFYKLGPDGRPTCQNSAGNIGAGHTIYGDGYAIAGYRSRHGEFLALEDVRNAIPWIERDDGDGDGEVEADTPEEILEVEAKFAAIRPYITIDSWTDSDQIGYGKFEQIKIRSSGDPDSPYYAYELTDRNATWNIKRNPMSAGWIPAENNVDGDTYAGELRGCYVAIISGLGRYQIKTIAANTTDTIILSESYEAGSEMRIPPNQHSSYIILGRDAGTDPKWKEQLKLYARQPLSFHRAPININTASDKVLTAALMGLQTTWGMAGYHTTVPLNSKINDMGGWAGASPEWADAMWQCPSVISIGRDQHNAYLTFDRTCPNDATFGAADANQLLYGHIGGREPYCFFCSFGHLRELTSPDSQPTFVNEAHYLAWQILKEREQTSVQDSMRGDENANGYGPFRGWDDIFYRVFYPHERGLKNELHAEGQKWISSVKAGGAASTSNWKLKNRHPGIARLCMANFNSNTDLLKFQPNLEYIDRWGPNFTDLYVPRPKFLATTSWGNTNSELALHTRPGELLDKTDLNIGTTEFCFDSGGVYDIVSVGRIYRGSKAEMTVVAERKFRALVKIYDVWRESTQREFTKGILLRAQGNAGTRQAGQYTFDASDRDERKALTTYPEAIVQRGHRVGRVRGPSKIASLAYDEYNDLGVRPAGYDGQILLSTNMYQDPGNLDPDVSFYNSFTGDIVADASRGDPRPGWTKGVPNLHFVPDIAACDMDTVSLLGTLDSPITDVAGTFEDPNKPFGPTNPIVEGEGVGGDFRPDGLHMGVTGKKYMDGSFEFGAAGNLNMVEGAVTMWIKPRWHQGTKACASLPITYRVGGADQRGSTACIPNASEFGPMNYPGISASQTQEYMDYWPAPDKDHTYKTKESIGKDARGYVRDRFEAELWNGVKPSLGNNKFTQNWRLIKAGDRSHDDSDAQMTSGGLGNASFAGLHYSKDSNNFSSWLPGHLASGNDGGRPFWQAAPFRWSFVGFTYDMGGVASDPDWYIYPKEENAWHIRGEGARYFGGQPHRISGQPLAQPTVLGSCSDNLIGSTSEKNKAGLYEIFDDPSYDKNVLDGAQGLVGQPEMGGLAPGWVSVVAWGHTKDHTSVHQLALLSLARVFMDGMLTWNKPLSSAAMDNGILYNRLASPPIPGSYDLGDWAFEQYSNMVKMGYPAANSVWDARSTVSFGINRNITELKKTHPSVVLYQGAFSGSFLTLDEYKIHLTGQQKNFRRDFDWAQRERNKVGRYYFPVDTTRSISGQIASEQEPSFESQSFYDSEGAQSYTFGLGEEDDQLEICTVRWTVFTPFFCVDKGRSPYAATDEWRFPFDSYFNSDTGFSRFDANYRDVASPAQIRLFYSSGGTRGKFTQGKYGGAGSTIKTDIRDHGVASRYSSQRGCKVKIQARDAAGGLTWFPPDRGDFYEHPEGGYLDANDIGCTEDGWQQVLLNPRQTTRQHPKCKPTDLKYKVFFRLSDLEYNEMKSKDLALVDSPVFDDITIVCMRRPKILEWRDVSE